MSREDSRRRLVVMAERTIAHNKAGTQHLTEGVTRIPASNYFDPERWQREVDLVFKRVPLLVATSAEIRESNSYKAIEIVGTPVLLSRGADGVLRAFVNMCSHRGAMLVEEGVGSARRFACPYHNWVYDQTGDLVGVFRGEDFGELDMSCLGLSPLPIHERAVAAGGASFGIAAVLTLLVVSYQAPKGGLAAAAGGGGH